MGKLDDIKIYYSYSMCDENLDLETKKEEVFHRDGLKYFDFRSALVVRVIKLI